jgi:ABC-type polysaccharide/polyol phosphate transport system ATPase subunit
VEPIIRVRGLSKRYRVGQRAKYGSLRESLASKFRAPRFLSAQNHKSGSDAQLHIWALHDVSLDVAPGEILGLIGSNGAGKSTLLKILSRITRPTAGHVQLYGRVRSLLEVGTGFHPELTGRENVFLNGAILGMGRYEIARKFDEIVAFSEVEKFIDTPVKYYSSGMYVRLAFAVAAYLEPEILLVDEVLAVGDSRFWQKSTDKMRELNARGMTIVLVTHNMWLIQTVCTRGVLLQGGHIAAEGRPQLVIDAYRRATESTTQEPAAVDQDEGEAAITSLELVPLGEWVSEHEATPASGIILNFTAHVPSHPRVKFLIRVASPDGLPFFSAYSDVLEVPSSRRLACRARILRLMVNGGDYIVWVGLCSEREREDVIAGAYVPLVVKEPGPPHPERGVFWNCAEWEIRQLAAHQEVRVR